MIWPIVKPTRRPTRAINKDAGIVETVVAVNWQASGTVDNDGSGAIISPAKALTAKSMELPDIAKAWHIARMNTFRRMLPTTLTAPRQTPKGR